MGKTNDMISAQGTVKEVLPDRRHRVEMDTGDVALATIAGRFRREAKTILVGDRVMSELSPFDLTRGRIVGRPS